MASAKLIIIGILRRADNHKSKRSRNDATIANELPTFCKWHWDARVINGDVNELRGNT